MLEWSGKALRRSMSLLGLVYVGVGILQSLSIVCRLVFFCGAFAAGAIMLNRHDAHGL